MGNTFAFEVNALNQVTREVAPAPLNYERRISYDANNNVVKIDGNAVTTTTFTYNILDHVTTKKETIDATHTALTEYQYDLNENLTRIIQPEGNSTFIEYDAKDLPYRVTKGYRSAEASTKTFTRDANGNVTAVKDGNGIVTKYTYDGFERLDQITDVAGGTMVVDHDEAGNITSISRRGPPDGADLAKTEFVYDALNRITSVIASESEAISHETKYIYDRSNRLTQFTDPSNHATQFVYDGASRLLQKTDPLGNQMKYVYDGNGNTLSESSVEGTETFTNTFVYDALNRLTKRNDNAGHAYTYEYDSRNNLIATTDPKDTPGLDNGATAGAGNKVSYSYE